MPAEPTMHVAVEAIVPHLFVCGCGARAQPRPVEIRLGGYGGHADGRWWVSGWQEPEGWSRFEGQDLCPACTEAVKATLEHRRAPPPAAARDVVWDDHGRHPDDCRCEQCTGGGPGR